MTDILLPLIFPLESDFYLWVLHPLYSKLLTFLAHTEAIPKGVFLVLCGNLNETLFDRVLFSNYFRWYIYYITKRVDMF